MVGLHAGKHWARPQPLAVMRISINLTQQGRGQTLMGRGTTSSMRFGGTVARKLVSRKRKSMPGRGLQSATAMSPELLLDAHTLATERLQTCRDASLLMRSVQPGRTKTRVPTARTTACSLVPGQGNTLP